MMQNSTVLLGRQNSTVLLGRQNSTVLLGRQNSTVLPGHQKSTVLPGRQSSIREDLYESNILQAQTQNGIHDQYNQLLNTDVGENENETKYVLSNKDKETDNFTELSPSSKILRCCFHDNCWVVIENLDQEVYTYPFHCHQLILAALGIVMYLYDVGSDILLTYEYGQQRMWTEFLLSAAIIAIPNIISSTFHTCFDFYYDSKEGISVRRNELSVVVRKWCIPTICTFTFMLGPVISQIDYMYNGWKSRSIATSDEKRKHFYTLKEKHHVHVCILRMMETFLEAIPQLIFQIYFILRETSQTHDTLLDVLRPAAMFGSWLAITLAPVSLYKFKKLHKHVRREPVHMPGLLLHFVLRGCEIAPRILVFAVFAAEFHKYTLIIIFSHWILMMILIKYQMYEHSFSFLPLNSFLLVFVGYVMIFTCMNVRGKKKYLNHIIYYSITYAENVGMLVAWAFYTTDKHRWYYLAVNIGVPVAMAVNVCVRICYYLCYHPERHNL